MAQETPVIPANERVLCGFSLRLKLLPDQLKGSCQKLNIAKNEYRVKLQLVKQIRKGT